VIRPQSDNPEAPAPTADRRLLVAAERLNGNARRSFTFAEAFACTRISLSDAFSPNASEAARTLLCLDKLGVTGSSPVPPRCVGCGSTENLRVHHIRDVADGGRQISET
jgi:hypothetical protein